MANYGLFDFFQYLLEKEKILTQSCDINVKIMQDFYLIKRIRKKTKNYFTKLHNLCYNILHTLLIF